MSAPPTVMLADEMPGGSCRSPQSVGGTTAGVATAVGVAVGQGGWTLAASLGLTAVLVASEFAFAAIRLIGAGYLVYLGAHSVWIAIRPGNAEDRPADARAIEMTPRKALRQGVLQQSRQPEDGDPLLEPAAPVRGARIVAVRGHAGARARLRLDDARLVVDLRGRRRPGRPHPAAAAGQASLRCGHGHDPLGVRSASGDRSALTNLVARQAARPSE